MATGRKNPMPSEKTSVSTPYAAHYPKNRARESTTAPAASGVRAQPGTTYQCTQLSKKKVD